MQAEDSHWLKEKKQNPKQKKNQKKGGKKQKREKKQNKKKVPEVVCKEFPFTEEGLALALGDLVNSCQLH